VAHLWFIFYLFIFSLVALPFFLYLKSEAGQHLVDILAAFFSRKGMILLAAVPLIVGNMLMYFYLNPFYYIIFFVYGYILMSDARFEEAVDRHRIVALILGPDILYFCIDPAFCNMVTAVQ
jgi:glucan biosynthesis protein C